jgi:hypothetical protein
MVKSIAMATRNYARGALRVFLEGKKNLNWVLGMIRSSGVRGSELAEIFQGIKSYSAMDRYQEALAACRDQGWL